MPNSTVVIDQAGGGLGTHIFSTISALALIVGIMFALFYLMRKYGHKIGLPQVKNDNMRLLGQMPLGPKRGLALVEVEDKKFLIGVTDNSINLISKIDDNEQTNDRTFLEALQEQDSSDTD